ncbi:MAG: hypothetical protein JXO72_02945 [Vicinamibacteria bacterium]|nr:hypothetical protein [Vicinamibacteria bacterium]
MEDSFKLLEGRIRGAVEEIQRLRGENAALAQKLEDALRRQIDAETESQDAAKRQADSVARQAETNAHRELKTLKREREEIRARLAKMLEVLEELG